jgi:hypothetical protein
MPSVMLTNQSGGQPILSGAHISFSGNGFRPRQEIYLKLATNASGNAYVGLSGGVTTTSGAYPLSGVLAGGRDGYVLAPGQEYVIPRGLLSNASGDAPNIFVATDAVASGFARLYYEVR